MTLRELLYLVTSPKKNGATPNLDYKILVDGKELKDNISWDYYVDGMDEFRFIMLSTK